MRISNGSFFVELFWCFFFLQHYITAIIVSFTFGKIGMGVCMICLLVSWFVDWFVRALVGKLRVSTWLHVACRFVNGLLDFLAVRNMKYLQNLLKELVIHIEMTIYKMSVALWNVSTWTLLAIVEVWKLSILCFCGYHSDTLFPVPGISPTVSTCMWICFKK